MSLFNSMKNLIDKLRNQYSKVTQGNSVISEIIKICVALASGLTLLIIMPILGIIVAITEEVLHMSRSILLVFSIVIAATVYFFNSDTHAINKKYQCDFDVFLPNWNEEAKKLGNKEISKNLEIPYKLYTDEELNDAKQDLAKEEYLPTKVIREAKEMLRKNEEFTVLWDQAHKRSIENIQKCKEYINLSSR